MSTSNSVPLGLDQKYCSECAKVILRRAEICPGCGCRQSNTPQPASSASGSALTQDPFVGHLIVLILLNCLWSGLGNLAVGDKRGGRFAAINIAVFIVGFFTAFIPLLLFFAYCCYEGYQFLLANKASTSY